MLRSSFLVAVFSAACAFAQDPESAVEVRHYDIRALASALGERSAKFEYLTPPGRPGGAGEGSVKYLWGEADAGEPNLDSVVELVRLALGGEPDVQLSEGMLKFEGPEGLQRRVPGVLAELQRTLGRTVEVELLILPGEALAQISSSVLDAAKIDRLLSVAKPLATLRTHVRLGSDTVLEAVARRAYVKDYDTEVAEGTKAFDPLIDVIPDGTRVGIRVDRAPDGSFVVTVRGQQVEAEWPARTITLNLETPAALQVPRIWWGSTSASARLADRAALIVGNDVTPRSVWAIRVLAPAASKPPEGATVQFVRVGGAVRPPLDDCPPTSRSPPPSGAGSIGSCMDADTGGRQRLDGELLMRRINAVKVEGVAADARRSARIGRIVALAGDPRWQAAAAEVVSKSVAEALRGYAVEVRYGTVPAEGFALPAPDELGTLLPSLGHRAMTAAIAGDRVVLVAGQDQKYLKDRDVEIAQGMTTDDPIIDDFFTGLSLSFRAVPSDEGRCAVDLHFEYQELIELASVPTGSKEVATTELPRITAAVADVPLDVALDSWTVAHTCPLEGTGMQLVVMVRVSRP